MVFKKGHKINLGKKYSEMHKENIRNSLKGKSRDTSHLKEFQFKKGQHSSPDTEFKKGNHPKTEFQKGQENYRKGTGNPDYKPKFVKINGKVILLSHLIWCRENQIHRVPDGCVIHHRDLNPQNNNPENLILMDDATHKSLHHAISKKILEQDNVQMI
jgi:hypothetical protein